MVAFVVKSLLISLVVFVFIAVRVSRFKSYEVNISELVCLIFVM